jgi:hypothetical protein
MRAVACGCCLPVAVMNITHLSIGELSDCCAGMHSKFLPLSAKAAAINGRMEHVIHSLARDGVIIADCRVRMGN